MVPNDCCLERALKAALIASVLSRTTFSRRDRCAAITRSQVWLPVVDCWCRTVQADGASVNRRFGRQDHQVQRRGVWWWRRKRVGLAVQIHGVGSVGTVRLCRRRCLFSPPPSLALSAHLHMEMTDRLRSGGFQGAEVRIPEPYRGCALCKVRVLLVVPVTTTSGEPCMNIKGKWKVKRTCGGLL